MTRARVLCIDANQLCAYAIKRGRLLSEGEFAANEAGVAQFSAYLRSTPRAVFSLVADLVEESYLTTHIPKLIGADRRAVIERRAQDALPGSRWHAAQSLGFHTEGARREERILIVGLHRTLLLEPWINALNDAGAAVKSLHLIAQAAPLMLAQAMKPLPPRALMLLKTPAGLRHAFIEGGALRFSRISPLPATPDAWLEEAEKTRQYLLRERLLGRTDTLPVVPFGLDAAPARWPGLDVQVADEARLTRLFGATTPREMALSALLRRPPASQLAPRPARFAWAVHRAKKALHALSACTALGGLSLGYAWLAQAQAIDALTPPPPPPAATSAVSQRLPELRALMASFDQLSTQSRGIDPMLDILSAALEAHPDIDIDRLDWRATPSTQPKGLARTLTVEGRVATDAPDIRNQLERIQRFHAHFQRLAEAGPQPPRLHAALTRLPVSLEPGQHLRSQDADLAPAGRFTLELTESP